MAKSGEVSSGRGAAYMVRVHSLAVSSILSVLCVVFCMMGHSRYGVKLNGGENYVSLWTVHTTQKTYDLGALKGNSSHQSMLKLHNNNNNNSNYNNNNNNNNNNYNNNSSNNNNNNYNNNSSNNNNNNNSNNILHHPFKFFLDLEMAKIPAEFLAVNLEENSFQDKIISARTFLLLDHYVNVAVFFLSIIFLLDILTETTGALIVIGFNITHVVFLLIACSCMTSGYNELLLVDRLAWGNNIVWAGFAFALLSLVATLIGLVADKITLNRRTASPNASNSIPLQHHE